MGDAARSPIAAPRSRHMGRGTSNGVDQVVMATGRMVDAVASAAGCLTLKRTKLRYRSVIIEQGNSPAVDPGKKIKEQFGFGFLRWAVVHAVGAKLARDPFRAISVTVNRAYPVAPEKSAKLGNNGLRIERRLDLADGVDHGAIAGQVSNCQSHAVGTAARRVHKAHIPVRIIKRPLADASFNTIRDGATA